MTAIALFCLLTQDPAELLRRAMEKGSVQEVYDAVEDLTRFDLAVLRKSAADSPEDVKRLLLFACEEIEAERAFSDFYRPPKRYTISEKALGLLTLLSELERESEESFDFAEFFDEGSIRDVTVEIRDAPFLRALNGLAKASDVFLGTDPDNGIFVTPEPYRQTPKFFYRNFMMELTSLSARKVIDFRSAPRRTLHLTWDVSWDRFVKPIRVLPNAVLEVARDDQGKNLILAAEEEKPTGPLLSPSFRASTVSTSTDFPSDNAKSITLLRGHIVLELPKKVERFTLKKIEAGSRLEAADFAFVVQTWDLDDDRGNEGHFFLRGDPKDLSRYRFRFFSRKKQGRIMEEMDGGGQIDFRVRFDSNLGEDDPIEPAPTDELTLIAICEVGRKNVPFEFREIRLEK